MTNEEFISLHREEDVRRLALSRAPEGVDLKWCLQQIEGWQIARRKLPSWAATEGIWYPVKLSMEQCSSEETARYKRSLVERLIPEERTSMVDLTGGLGVDFSQLAPLFREATYVEVLPQLIELAQHNFPLLGIRDATCTDNSSSFTLHPSLFFIDPARRDDIGRKTVSIGDCTPNLLDMQDELLAKAQWVMVKLSPMLDITQALRELHGVREVHVVSVQGECKELLMVIKANAEGPVTIHCVNLGTDEDAITSPYPPLPLKRGDSTASSQTSLPLMKEMKGWLYEPNPSILKAGISDVLTEWYPVMKLHPRSNLFVSEQLIAHFPGRRFRIVGVSDFSKKNLKALIGDLDKANLTVRNFPTNVEKLRRQLRLAEGGDTYLFATTLNDGQHALIRCEKT